ncbi:putative cytochrome P450 oxidoreductase [Rosellinia necatrix]|uniref:Putative cytochrome P450 oxidoreductase n=1 Tax=Rosellinia necatrix TaxID=77044 RepID=A0A1W2TAL1_ROSNE|nr:putative cytochrome P450 oxidoreductase [Rosellinia necatrix]
MISSVTAAVAGLASSYVFIWALLRLTQDSREPPTLEHDIPFLSPIVSMASKGSRFHSYLRDKYKQPIYTLRLPGSRLYIINDTSLIPIVQRQVRTLSISPIMVRIFSHFMGVSKQALDIMGSDPLEHHGFVHQITLETGKGLSPGPNLDELNANAVQILNASLGNLCAKEAPTTVKLFDWASHEIMVATTNAVYGRRNPFKDPAVRSAYYTYEAGLITLITGFLPSILAREPLRARDILTNAFVKYFSEGGLDEGSSVYARNRYEYPSKLGVPLRDVAKMEAGGSIGLISNSMPATFWMLYHAFSDSNVLEDCRQEVAKACQEKDGQKYLDLAYIKNHCPILLSTMQEAFRFHSIGMSARTVVEDHLLDGKYLLKKGQTVLIPSTVQHASAPAWGANVDKFYHKRFVKEPGTKKYDPVAFRAFGGGTTLCPGRHFASTEILAFTSAILLRFDIEPINGSWDTRGYKEANAAFRLPGQDLHVKLTPRDNKEWKVFFSEPGKPIEV